MASATEPPAPPLSDPGARAPSPSSHGPWSCGPWALGHLLSSVLAEMPGKQSDEEQVAAGAAENGTEEDLGGLTAEELRQGQEAALALEDMMALSTQTLVRAEVDELYQQVRPLGQGRFGRVLLVNHRQKGTRVGAG